MTTTPPSIHEQLGTNTLVGLVIQTRHGLRFPYKKVFPGNQNWPVSPKFWGVMDGMLTPTGSAQMTDVGQKIAKKYKFGEETPLLPSSNYSKYIYVQSTHKPRTILSGMAFLQGAFPDGLLRLDCAEDHQNGMVQQHPPLEQSQQQQQQQQSTITINIPFLNTKDDPFCNLQHLPEYVEKKKKMFGEEGRWGEWEKDERYPPLLEKLWKMTAWEKISPSLPLRSRLQALYGIEENLELDLNLPLLPFRNPFSLSLSPEEIDLVGEVSLYTWEVRYCGHTEEDMKEMAGVLGRGMGKEVVKRLGGLVEGGERGGEGEGEGGERVFYFSSHDTAIAPFLALLGVRGFSVPKTGCYLLFELHFVEENNGEEKGKENEKEKKGNYYVRTIINFDPIGEGEEGERGVNVQEVGKTERMGKERGVGAEAVVSWEDFKKRVDSFF